MRKAVLLLLLAVCGFAAAPIPRAEYPRPQFQREQWLNLNGPWEFEFDDANTGLDENWASGAKRFAQKHRGSVLLREFAQRHRRHLVPSLDLVSPHVHGAAGLERAARSAPLRRGELLGHGVGKRQARGAARGREHPVFLRHHAARRRRGQHHHRAVGVSANGPHHPARQAILGAEIAQHLLHAHERHLADGMAGAGRANTPR